MASLIRWAEVDQMQVSVQRLGLAQQVLQLEGGKLGGDALVCRVGPLTLLRLRMERSLHSWGPKPSGQIMVTLDLEPLPRQASLRSHGQALPFSCLFGLDPRREVHLTLPSSTVLGVIIVNRTDLERWAADLGWPDLDGEQAFRSNWIPTDPQCCDELRRYLRQLFTVVQHSPGRLREHGIERLVVEDLMPLLIAMLVQGAHQTQRLAQPPARIEVVQMAQRWMREHPLEPITLADLCRSLHVSRRCLIQGFREHLGMGPMAFLKLQRLHGVRRLLINADAGLQRIGPLAAEWGFLNAGHFARDYRRLFGELPRQSLQRQAAASALSWPERPPAAAPAPPRRSG